MESQKEYFSNSIKQCENGMYALAFGILRDENDALDVMQESILKAYCNLHTLKHKNKFKQWIMTIVHNTAMDFLKKKRNIVDINEENNLDISEKIVRNSIDYETKLTLWQSIEKLKLPYRTIIILFYYEDYSIKQISEITGTSNGAVRQQLARGRKMLADLLDENDFKH